MIEWIHNIVEYILLNYITLHILSIVLLILVGWTFWGPHRAINGFITLIKGVVKKE